LSSGCLSLDASFASNNIGLKSTAVMRRMQTALLFLGMLLCQVRAHAVEHHF